ncbi:MAG: chorismate synthase [Candidatus Bathyarchaeota archaeon]|nr:chorismate synthase [Candidatus Bathyarchaeota archaeon]
MSNTIGNTYRFTTFGESHGVCVGVVIDGCPAGHKVDLNHIQSELDRRRPGQSNLTTTRNEPDKVEVISGIFNGVTTGAPICMVIRNKDRNSSKYETLRWTPRPGHADYTAEARYGGHQDYRGGGRFSGRNTAALVMAGALAKQIIASVGVQVMGYTAQIGDIQAPEPTVEEIKEHTESNPVRCPDQETAEKMIQAIEEAKIDSDSIGGKVKCLALYIPPGVGQPVFDTLEGDLAKALFSVPAVKAVEFGAGVLLASMRGSESNDPFNVKDGKIGTESNNSGGIQGGISNGMPITCTVTFKPTPSIAQPQTTVNMKTLEETTINIHGRHDPCIVPRAVPVVESMTAAVLLDHLLRSGHVKQVMEEQK